MEEEWIVTERFLSRDAAGHRENLQAKMAAYIAVAVGEGGPDPTSREALPKGEGDDESSNLLPAEQGG